MHSASRKIKIVFYLSVLLVVVLVSYKVYLNFFEQDFEAVHAAQVERIQRVLADADGYRFAVVGNVNNSVGIFERKIIPMLNRSGVDFVVSAGNAVSSGGEDKYRALYRTLSRLEMPYLLTFGEKEDSRLGGFRYYEHFGPYLFSFMARNSHFIFLDSTGTTDYQWQLRWFEENLATRDADHRFVFSSHPLKPAPEEGLFDFDEDYLFPSPYRSQFEDLIQEYGVDVVFSANLPLFLEQRDDGTRYILTGGAGGFVPESESGFYHYVDVRVDDNELEIAPRRLDIGQHVVWRTLESLWFFIHSLFYVGYLNFLLLLGVLVAVATWLYSRIFVDRDYYPNFETDPEQYRGQTFRIAMFTNNYLPFIGGVPISILRLCRGLMAVGHEVRVIAPTYQASDQKDTPDSDVETFRVKSLLPLGKHREFRLANIFSPALYREVVKYRPDIIHVHHPFWLGSAGVFLARRLNVPVVYTYHTRLEHYAHYVPLPGPLFRNLISHALVRRFANRCDSIIVPTESAEEYLYMIGVKRPIYVQPTGIDYDRFQAVPDSAVHNLRQELGLAEEETILLSVSRLSKEKNIDFMLDGIRQIMEREPSPFRLLIIGAGPEHDRLQTRITTEGLDNNVTLVGAVAPEDVPLYCRLGDIFLFASRSETQGMVILEAMAAGMPVVAVRASGIDDIIRNGFNGFKTALDAKQWSNRVVELLADPALRKELSGNAARFSAGYGLVPFSESILQVYARALASRADGEKLGNIL